MYAKIPHKVSTTSNNLNYLHIKNYHLQHITMQTHTINSPQKLVKMHSLAMQNKAITARLERLQFLGLFPP